MPSRNDYTGRGRLTLHASRSLGVLPGRLLTIFVTNETQGLASSLMHGATGLICCMLKVSRSIRPWDDFEAGVLQFQGDATTDFVRCYGSRPKTIEQS
ncbi:hypothetical protein EVAR_27941_1 [Eumeta japonica]|uniref:Uncharacterized protein n=1 Tax=Eumeta variegata TaxID=151549 RepID=A0A4C1UWC8_EUMVA|nr:hypothetical protein EVAR_27941_1 [Eumeta japonica]